MKVEFLKSPTALFKLAYFVGDIVEIKDKEKCLKMIEMGIAKEVVEKKVVKKRSSK